MKGQKRERGGPQRVQVRRVLRADLGGARQGRSNDNVIQPSGSVKMQVGYPLVPMLCS